MTYQPTFQVSPRLERRITEIEALRARVESEVKRTSLDSALRDEARVRNAHASTAIEGNPLTLEQVQAIAEGRGLEAVSALSIREIKNALAGLQYIEGLAELDRITHEHVFELHRHISQEVMHQGEPGRYRSIRVRVGPYFPPPPNEVSGLMFELLEWWNSASHELSPVLSSAIVHYRFEAIHPFADGNGRAGRALGLWDLYRRRFDANHIFPLDEYYWEDRPRYYAALQAVRRQGEDLTSWLDYCAEGLLQAMQRLEKRLLQAG